VFSVVLTTRISGVGNGAKGYTLPLRNGALSALGPIMDRVHLPPVDSSLINYFAIEKF
jgi:hypothetical protein